MASWVTGLGWRGRSCSRRRRRPSRTSACLAGRATAVARLVGKYRRAERQVDLSTVLGRRHDLRDIGVDVCDHELAGIEATHVGRNLVSSHPRDRCRATTDVAVILVMDEHGLPPVLDPYGPAHLSGAAGRREPLAWCEELRGWAGEDGVLELPGLADRYLPQGPDERVDGRTINASGLDGDEKIAFSPGEDAVSESEWSAPGPPRIRRNSPPTCTRVSSDSSSLASVTRMSMRAEGLRRFHS